MIVDTIPSATDRIGRRESRPDRSQGSGARCVWRTPSGPIVGRVTRHDPGFEAGAMSASSAVYPERTVSRSVKLRSECRHLSTLR